MKPTFIQFANAFFKVSHYKWGLIPYQTLKHHVELNQLYNEHKFVICKKYRQGGFSTFSALWCLFHAMTIEGWRGLLISRNDRCAVDDIGRILRFAYNFLPEELKLNTKTYNDHELSFENGSCIRCLSHHSLGCRGTHQDAIIFDEPAFFSHLEENYKMVYPMVSTGGKIFMVSSPNGKQGFFYKLYQDAVLNKNDYYAYSPSCMEIHSEEKLLNLKESLGNKGLHQELFGEFLDLEA